MSGRLAGDVTKNEEIFKGGGKREEGGARNEEQGARNEERGARDYTPVVPSPVSPARRTWTIGGSYQVFLPQ